MDIRTLSTSTELLQAFEVIKDLRPHLSQEKFLSLYDAAQGEGHYTIKGGFIDGRLVAVMGYRILHDLVHGRHLYIDDLNVLDTERSKGIGAAFLKWSEEEAQRTGCERLRLCTGVQNEAGIRFYKRAGWEPLAFAFKKKVPCDIFP